MGKNKNISLEVRHSIKVLYEMKYSHGDIAKHLDVSKSAVTRALQRNKETGTLKDRKRTGRPKVTSRRQDMLIGRYVKKNPFASSKEIKTNLNLNVSRRLIRHRLSTDMKFKTRKPLKKPLITPKQAKKRLEFCKKYENWSDEHWKTVMFSDESAFYQFQGTETFVRVPDGASVINPKYTKKPLSIPNM